jgi:hypothetical protein
MKMRVVPVSTMALAAPESVVEPKVMEVTEIPQNSL